MKLFTIGDSVSQGFMSLAAAQTDNAYSTLIAKRLGLTLKQDYFYADWNKKGIPLDIEFIMRELQARYGSNIGGFEWFTVASTINRLVDESEDYYERGDGRADQKYDDKTNFFNNVAVWGFDAADSFQVTPRVCKEMIYNKQRPTQDNLFSLGPDNPMYRTALKVLNPSLDPVFDEFSQLDWLRLHATGVGKPDADKKTITEQQKTGTGEGVENLILWLGANNALGTVINLRINQTPNKMNAAGRPHEYDHIKRSLFKWNLWHPEDFKADYGMMIDQVDTIMRNNLAKDWKVFIGTVPLVTIAPIAKGVGETTDLAFKKYRDGEVVSDSSPYFKYYTYFPFEEKFAIETGKYLTMQDALHIDNCIRAYNQFIFEKVAELNEAHSKTDKNSPDRYFVVDTSKTLEDLAYKRNYGNPPYELPDALKFLYPPVNTKYYHADTDGKLKQGGLFSLDGVHPTSIGHGILAREFIKKMMGAGVKFADNPEGQGDDTGLQWNGPGGILESDLLYAQPLKNMQELYGKDGVASLALRIIDSITSVNLR
jgi:hypothetical protein